MLGLVLKDLLVQKKTVYSSVLVILPVILFMKTNTPLLGFFFGLMIIGFNPVMRLFVLEEKNKNEVILNSLPLSRVEIVGSRYLSSLVFFAYAICLTSLCYAGLRFAGMAEGLHYGMVLLFGFSLSVFNASVMFPIFFRWGYSKATAAVLIVFFLPFLIAGVLGPHLPNISSTLVRSALALSDAAKAVIVFLLAAVLLSLSMALSIRFYKSREF